MHNNACMDLLIALHSLINSLPRMQKLILSLLLISSISLTAFAHVPNDGYVKVNSAASSITWIGKKVTGQHNGSIAIQDGTLQFKKGALVGGSFSIDMTSIKVLDLQGETAGKLEGHLKSDDFFGVVSFPSATLIILDAREKGKGNFDVKANLTIKGITRPVEFPVTLTPQGNGYKATANITIDRSQYDIKYGSSKFFDNLGDKTIHDDFELNVSIVAE